jgi:hypothetical protein
VILEDVVEVVQGAENFLPVTGELEDDTDAVVLPLGILRGPLVEEVELGQALRDALECLRIDADLLPNVAIWLWGLTFEQVEHPLGLGPGERISQRILRVAHDNMSCSTGNKVSVLSSEVVVPHIGVFEEPVDG